MNMKTLTVKKSSQTIKAIAGILVPILYISMVIILGLLEPGYNQRTMMMSILGGVPGYRGAIFNLGLVLIGSLLIVFGFALHRNINQGHGNCFDRHGDLLDEFTCRRHVIGFCKRWR